MLHHNYRMLKHIAIHKIIYFILAVFCFQHLIRDHLQDEGVKDWYTTVGHSWFKFIPDTKHNNHIGMVVLFLLGCLFLYLTFRK
jgi:hypothetical protein